MLEIRRTNTILYCKHWQETVGFFRESLRLPVSFENEWFVEFQLTENAFLSIANAARATIDDVEGKGVTLSWQVSNLAQLRTELVHAGLVPTEIRHKWNARTCFIHDPEGHRIEFWQSETNQALGNCDLETSVTDWLIEHPSLLPLIQELGIDYCCGGKSLEFASQEQGLDPGEIYKRFRDFVG